VVVAVAGAGAYYYYTTTAPTPPTPVTTTAVTTPLTTAAPVTTTTAVEMKTPLEMNIWPFMTEIVEENVKEFNRQYDENLELRQIPGDYNVAIENKLAAGTPPDLCYSMADTNNKWYKAGWIQELDAAPWADELKRLCFPGLLDACKSVDGKLIALPYANQTSVIYRNLSLLTDYKDYYPNTKEEFLDHLLELKKKKIADRPWCSTWGKLMWQLPGGLISECTAEGDYLFDENLDPTFDVNTGIRVALDFWKALWDNKLVAEEIWTWTDADYMGAFETGQYAYTLAYDSHTAVYNDPNLSKIAGKIEFMPHVPGKTGEATNFAALYSVGKKERTSSEMARVYNLGSFMAFKDKYGEYFVPKRFATLAKFPPNYLDMAQDPEVKAIFLQMMTEKEWDWQQNWMRTLVFPKEWRAFWYPEWANYMYDQVYNGITGKQSIPTTIQNMRKEAEDLKKKYP